MREPQDDEPTLSTALELRSRCRKPFGEVKVVRTFGFGLTIAAGVVAALWNVPQSRATPCLASPTCTLDGQTFTLTGGTSGNGLTFLASFTTPDQNNSDIAQLVDDYLALKGFTVTYLGRQDGSGTIDGDSITVTGGSQSGTWTLNPGTTNDVGAFVAIHAGNGQDDELFQINSPGLSGTWGTENGKDLSNFDLFGTANNGNSPPVVPEPGTLAILASALIGFSAIRRYRKLG